MRLVLAVFLLFAIGADAATPPTPPPAGAQQPSVTFCWDNAAGALVACPALPAPPSAPSNSSTCTVPTGTAAIVIPLSNTRKWVMITSRTTGTEVQDIGSSNVIVNGGIPLAPGGGFLFTGLGAKGPIYGIAPIASPCSFVEG